MAFLLIFLIGAKVAMPAFAESKQEKVVSAEQGDDDSDKKAEDDLSLKKEKEAIGFYNEHTAFLPQQIDILHNTAYQNNYKSSHHRKVTIPPPDSV
ncbi:hypothetical protein FPZ43_11055 [Mucilaginibacter pallidiroseus]|uniref:Uncharacterized protein n=1 Tax=Mucilaginibacter pallidiroseus TaxID=2599295 RepID=A0A563UBR0_9SPHI|nr:hypothetical protein [Mucilaginibacter pallidiroseus]TWR28802.1 hypothetical protein FPZ43_11055 [Mucilaginibacter pallidiroseus]